MLLKSPNLDDYGVVVNGTETYKFLSQVLLTGQTVLIAWTDERGTMFDIVLSYGAFDVGAGNHQHGTKARDLFVSIIGLGSFSFESKYPSNVSPGYISEKLRIGNLPTSAAIAELLTGIISSINH